MIHNSELRIYLAQLKESVDVKSLHQRLTNVFCKGPGSKYFRLASHTVSVVEAAIDTI